MRIVGGRHRGRRLLTPKGQGSRPTAERVREALFDILLHGDLSGRPFQGARVLDVFAGSGALGLEALSRGAADVTAIENGEAALQTLHANAERLGENQAFEIRRADATRLPPSRRAFDYAFLDAPYKSGLSGAALTSLAQGGWLRCGAVLVVELSAQEPFDPPQDFALLDERRYGAARIVFLRWTAQ